jgi:hypothetical protein
VEPRSGETKREGRPAESAGSMGEKEMASPRLYKLQQRAAHYHLLFIRSRSVHDMTIREEH